MKKTLTMGILTGLLITLTACGPEAHEGQLCNHAGATANNGTLVCKRNGHSTGPLVWRNK